MKQILAACLAGWVATPLFAQDLSPEAHARLKGTEARYKASSLLEVIDGVSSVGLGGSGTDYRILIVVRDYGVKAAAKKAIGGDELAGVKVMWTVTGSVGSTPYTPPPQATYIPGAVPVQAANAPSTYGVDPNNPWQTSVTDCDIIRDHLKMRKMSHPTGDGRYWGPCQTLQRSTLGPAGGHTFIFTKHRPDCSIRLGRIGMPSWSDHYMAWVFQKGITPAVRAGFLWPFELRGSDSLWQKQVSQDMASTRRYIRESASVTSTPGYGTTWMNSPASSQWSSPYPATATGGGGCGN